MLVKEEGITVTGTLKEFSRTSDKGNLVKAYFCPECGVRIYGKPGYVKGVVSLKPGTLDDTSWLNPDTALWVKSSQNWFELPEHTDKIEIETVEEDNKIILKLTVDDDDKGKIIGKNGKIAKSIRNVLKLASIKGDSKYILEII